MKQSRLMSWLETCLSTAIGFVVAITTQLVVFPLFGFSPPLSHNLMIGALFTVVSVARGYLVRRLFEAMHIRRPLSPFMQAVIAERIRHVDGEGWSPEHDDGHDAGELALAGAAYAQQAPLHLDDEIATVFPPATWPWERGWWKPTGFRRDLVKAAALIIAEGEKFDRARKRRTA